MWINEAHFASCFFFFKSMSHGPLNNPDILFSINTGYMLFSSEVINVWTTWIKYTINCIYIEASWYLFKQVAGRAASPLHMVTVERKQKQTQRNTYDFVKVRIARVLDQSPPLRPSLYSSVLPATWLTNHDRACVYTLTQAQKNT